jgi:hypothetical protein
MYDNNADNWQNQAASWNKAKNVFTFESKGKNASYPSQSNPGEYARLWNAGAPNGSGEATKGTYLDYQIKFVASGITVPIRTTTASSSTRATTAPTPAITKRSSATSPSGTRRPMAGTS